MGKKERREKERMKRKKEMGSYQGKIQGEKRRIRQREKT